MKKTPLKRKTPIRKSAKKKTRGWYSKQLDSIAQTFAKERDGYICQKCGKKVSGTSAHGSHVIPKSISMLLRWNLNNIKCLCFYHHRQWWHMDITEASAWFKSAFPERWEYLQNIKNKKLNISTPTLCEFYERARQCKTWHEYQRLHEEEIACKGR